MGSKCNPALVVDSNEEEPWLYTDDQKWTVALLKLLDDMNAPDYAFASVLRWARGANAARYSFYPDGGLSRSRSIDLLFLDMKNATQFLPSVVNVTTPHGPPRDVIVFDFVPQLLRLLQNPKLMTADNLLIDPVNPLLPYASPQGELGDAISGQVYRDAYERMITNPERQFFVPIINGLTAHLSPAMIAFLEAIHVYASNFKEPFRRKIQAWVYPATDFSNGITNLTKISAAERVGLVFLFVILAQYDEGWIILSKALQQKDRTSLRKVINVFEALLCFDQWLNQPTYWTAEHHDKSVLQVSDAITKLMEMCKKDIPLFKKKTWKFPKFHELKHILNDMKRFGAPINYCAQRPESLLIPVAKQPGRRAQKRHTGALYELQAAQRLSYSLMIAEVHSRIWGDANTAVSVPSVDAASIFESTGNATFGVLFRNTNMMLNVQWATKTDVRLMHLPTPLMEFMWTTFGPHVRFCTEYVRDQYTFRCHPAYQSDNPINDWMNVLFEVMDTKTNTYIKRLQSTTERTSVQSVLLTEWCWSSEYLVILPSNIVGPCFVISIKPDMSKVLEALPLDSWASEFTKPVDEYSSSSDDDDDEEMHTDSSDEEKSIDFDDNVEEEEEEEEDGDY
ncbi:hypothetical protein MHU86_21672 [Fragilaria crotonensis]|nr:hypothetical protein MHU86_21672 [Fragilaria crotonensis]